MKLSEIVRINDKGLVADAVNLKMMDDPAKNLQLCEGFIFNYDAQKPKESTVGVLVRIQESFHGANHPNVHLIVQDYGKGKSHFALVLANYFRQAAESAELHGILHQVELAVGSHGSVAEDLRNYKGRSRPHLVIRLSGDNMIDLKAAFLKSLRAELEAAGVTQSIGQHLCDAPLAFLRHLSATEREQAEAYLTETQPNLNLAALRTELENDNYSLIHLVTEISRRVHAHGLPIAFESDLDLEAILAAIVEKLCSGAEARFAGVLILFDELLPYLQGWANNSSRYGGAALQNLTNACENHKGRLALVTFSQYRPQIKSGISLQSLNDYQKLTSRLEKLESAYEPRASLELVIDNLILQSEGTAEWREFEGKWAPTIKSDSERVFNEFVPKYKEQGWKSADFYKHLGLGSFPLHPLTACLLANLEFTQNRTVIGFIKEDVSAHIEAEEAEFNGKPNYVPAYRLVEAFKSSLSGHPIYHDYQKARAQVQAAAEATHLRVLESLFLYYAVGQRLTKRAEDEHSKILSAISGLSEMTVRESLRDLCDKFHVLHYVSDSKLYRFYQGTSPAEVSRLIDEEIGDKQATLGELARYGEQLPFFTQTSVVTPQSFVDEFKLVGEDWQYARIFVPAQELEKALSAQGRLANARGVVAHILYEQPQDRQAVYEQAQELLAEHPEAHRVLIAIPEEPVGGLLRVLKQRDALDQYKPTEKQRLGAAFDQQLESWTKMLSAGLEKAVNSVEYYCAGIERLLLHEKRNPQELISRMLKDNYRFVPPVERIERMKAGHSTGTKVSGFIARKLLSANEIPQPLPDKSYQSIFDQVFADSWHLLIKSSDRYKVTTPTNPKIKAAWDEIEEMTALGEADTKEISVEKIWERLSAPPFGYNDLTFTVLFVAWLAVHRREVAFKGDLAITLKAREVPQSTETPRAISEWATTNVFEKPRDFLSYWVKKPQNRLIRRKPATLPTMPESCDYDAAKELLARIEEFLGAGNGAPDQVAEAGKNRDELSRAVKSLDQWADSIRKLEEAARRSELNVLVSKIYSERKGCFPPAATSGKPAVSPSEEHHRLSRLVLEGLDELVQTKIEVVAEGAARVDSEQKFGEYKNEIESINRLLVGPLEQHKETLQTALRNAQARVEERQRESAIKSVADEVTEIRSLIDANTSQHLCTTKRDRLKQLAQAHPQIAAEEMFLSVRRKLEQCLDTLAQQLSKWEQNASAVTSLQEANALRNEINRQSNRYTESLDRERVNALLERVEQICTAFQAQETAKANQAAAFSDFKLTAERAGNTEMSHVSARYEEGRQKLDALTAKYAADAPFIARLNDEWERAQERVGTKLAEAVSQELQEIGQYEQLKAKLESAAEIVRLEDFAGFASQVTGALERLESRREELRLEQQDRETLKRIRAHTARHLNTVALLDEAAESIRRLSAELHQPEEAASEIQKALLEIEEQRAGYGKQLEELEGKVNRASTAAELSAAEKEMLRAEAVFKASSLAQPFEMLHAKLRELRATAELLAALSSEAGKADTIADCLRVKVRCGEVAAQINDSRFEAQINDIVSQLTGKVERIAGQLAAFEKQLLEGGFEQVKKLRQDLARCHHQYAGSPQQETCDRLAAEAEAVAKLLELGRQQPRSIEHAQLLIEDAARMIADSGAETVQKRGAEVRSALQARQADLRQEEERKARKTLEDCFRRWKEIEAASDTITKIRQGEEFLLQVAQQKQSLNQFLPAEHEADVDELIKAVQVTLNGDRETQICALFSGLPEEVKGRVYARLSELMTAQHVLLNGQAEAQPMTESHV